MGLSPSTYVSLQISIQLDLSTHEQDWPSSARRVLREYLNPGIQTLIYLSEATAHRHHAWKLPTHVLFRSLALDLSLHPATIDSAGRAMGTYA